MIPPFVFAPSTWPDWLFLPLAALVAVGLDRLLGEPRRWHPLVGFGRLAAGLEARLNRGRRAAGVAAWLLAVGPWVGLAGLRVHSVRASTNST